MSLHYFLRTVNRVLPETLQFYQSKSRNSKRSKKHPSANSSSSKKSLSSTDFDVDIVEEVLEDDDFFMHGESKPIHPVVLLMLSAILLFLAISSFFPLFHLDGDLLSPALSEPQRWVGLSDEHGIHALNLQQARLAAMLQRKKLHIMATQSHELSTTKQQVVASSTITPTPTTTDSTPSPPSTPSPSSSPSPSPSPSPSSSDASPAPTQASTSPTPSQQPAADNAPVATDSFHSSDENGVPILPENMICTPLPPRDSPVNYTSLDYLGLPSFTGPIIAPGQPDYNADSPYSSADKVASAQACCMRCYTSPNCLMFMFYVDFNMCVLKGGAANKHWQLVSGAPEQRYMTTSERMLVGYLPTHVTSHLPFKSFVIPPEMELGEHPGQQNASYPHCPPLPPSKAPEHGSIGFCGNNPIAMGAPCIFQCDPGYSLSGQLPICGRNGSYFVEFTPITQNTTRLAQCIPVRANAFEVALQYQVDYRPGQFPTPIPVLPPLSPSCQGALGLCLNEATFEATKPSAAPVAALLVQYLNSLHIFSPDPNATVSAPQLKRLSYSVQLNHYMDPTGTYSIWPPAIIVGNMIHRTDRLAGMLEMLQQLNYPLDRVFRFPSIRFPIPYWGNIFTNFKANEWAIAQQFPWYMYWEDDIRTRVSLMDFIRNMNELGRNIHEIMKNDHAGRSSDFHYYAVKLEGNGMKFKGREKLPPNLRHIIYSFQAGAYLLNGTYAPRLQQHRADIIPKFRSRLNMDDPPNREYRNDRSWCMLMNDNVYKWYQPMPNWMGQLTGFSDMEGMFIKREVGNPPPQPRRPIVAGRPVPESARPPRFGAGPGSLPMHA